MFMICLVVFCCYFASAMRLPVVPLYARSLGINIAQIGIINTAFFLMAGSLSLPLGLLSDRLGRKPIATIGLLILVISSFLLYFGKTFAQLTWIYLFIGIGIAAFGPTTMSFVADFSPSTHLGRSYGWYTTSLYSGLSIGPAVGGFVAQGLGFLNVFLFSGILIFLIFWAVIFFLPFTSFIKAEGLEQQSTATILKELFKNRPLIGCWLAGLGGCYGLGMFMTFIPLHAQNQGLNVRQIGLVFFAQGLCNALSRIPMGYFSDKVANRSILVVIGLIGFAASMVGFGISENMGHFTMFAITLGVSMGLAFTSIGALIAEVVAQESRGLAMGGYNTCIYYGMMLSAAFMGGVIQIIGFENGFFITALLNFIIIGLFHLLIKEFYVSKKELNG
jgi:MFS family permease